MDNKKDRGGVFIQKLTGIKVTESTNLKGGNYNENDYEQI